MAGRKNNGASGGRATEQHYLVGELSALWGYSPKTIRRIFALEAEAISVGHDEELHKRGYRTLSIPASVAERVHRRLEQGGNGRPGQSR